MKIKNDKEIYLVILISILNMKMLVVASNLEESPCKHWT